VEVRLEDLDKGVGAGVRTHANAAAAAFRTTRSRTTPSRSRRRSCRLSVRIYMLYAHLPSATSQGQRTYGNRWTLIASLLPGRCNNDIKNYFNLYLKCQVRWFPGGEGGVCVLSGQNALQCGPGLAVCWANHSP
jgi:hypothetical protein